MRTSGRFRGARGAIEIGMGSLEVVAVEPCRAKRKTPARVVWPEADVGFEVRQGLGWLMAMNRNRSHRVIHERVVGRQRHGLLQCVVRFAPKIELDAGDAKKEMNLRILRLQLTSVRQVTQGALEILLLVCCPGQIEQQLHFLLLVLQPGQPGRQQFLQPLLAVFLGQIIVGRLLVSGEDRLIFRTFIGEPSDSNCSSYFLPFPSIALQEMLETCLVAKLPSCLHIPADDSTNGTGRPSTLGLCLEFSSIRSICSS